MNMDDPHYRDCVRDVLAMLEQALTMNAADAGSPACALAKANMKALFELADIDVCLRVAVSMLATSWQMAGNLRAEARGTSAEQELERIFATFREHLT